MKKSKGSTYSNIDTNTNINGYYDHCSGYLDSRNLSVYDELITFLHCTAHTICQYSMQEDVIKYSLFSIMSNVSSCLTPILTVTLSPVLRSWSNRYAGSVNWAACQTSVFTSAWANCVVPHPNSVYSTGLSTIAEPLSTPCAQTSTRSTAWP